MPLSGDDLGDALRSAIDAVDPGGFGAYADYQVAVAHAMGGAVVGHLTSPGNLVGASVPGLVPAIGASPAGYVLTAAGWAPPTALADATYGDVTVSGSGTSIAVDKVAGTTPSSAGLAVLAGANAAAQRASLGLGTAATTASSAYAASSHSHAEGDVTGLTTDLAAKAPLANPTLTGTPAAPTASSATSTTQIATTAFVHAVVTDLIGAAPAALDTLKELADAINDDASFAGTVTAALAGKQASDGTLSALATLGASSTAGIWRQTGAATVVRAMDTTAGRALLEAANVAAQIAALGLATVATSGAYADLSGTPSLAAVATSGAYADVTGTPSLATVATTGSASDLGTGTLPVARIATAAIVLAKIADGTALSVLGRSANSGGAYADIVAGSDGDVLRRSGTAIGFGAIPNASVTGLGTAALVNTGTGSTNVPTVAQADARYAPLAALRGGSAVMTNPLFATSTISATRQITVSDTVAVYVGKAPYAAASAIVRARVTATMGGPITWCECAIAKGSIAVGGNPSLTLIAFTDVSATFNSQGQKSTTVTGAIAAGDDLWVLLGAQAGTGLTVRAQSIADDTQVGVQVTATARPSTMAAPTTFTLEGATILAPWVSLVIG